MSRIVMSLENDFEGKVLASFDLDELASKAIEYAEEDAENRMNRILDEEKILSYEQGRADAINERASLLAFICKKYDIPLVDMNCTVDEWEELKEQK